ncbi:ABC transporter [Bordetella genomosp. 10]|uniref:ABC transporter n=1 Tax=Bordetella genomosp. 10 TaxID=1416804 RepID=A0A261S2L1_9BORD|nr:transporter substrate-binding domain-containing protein [Bordetella genomosp. 10]OZI31586.1 ABC transporter [Bordetella genomosp. 10]
MRSTFFLAPLAVALALAAPVSAHADQLQEILGRGKLICGVQNNTPPFSFPDPATRAQVGHDVDLCNKLGEALKVGVELKPLSTEARVPSITMGHVDVAIANLAYTKARGEQIQFSDPYYIAKEMLVVHAADAGKSKADFVGKRIASSKGSTGEVAIRLTGSTPVTYQDISGAYLALVQNNTTAFVTNGMTARKLILKAKETGESLALIKEPIALEPIGIGMKKNEPALLAKVNSLLQDWERAGVLDALWTKWISSSADYDHMPREDKVVPLTSIKFEPLP